MTKTRITKAKVRVVIQWYLKGSVIKGTVGYKELSRRTDTPEKSLIRMFGPRGNPTAANLFNVLRQLQRRTGFRLEVRRSPRRPPRRGVARAA